MRSIPPCTLRLNLWTQSQAVAREFETVDNRWLINIRHQIDIRGLDSPAWAYCCAETLSMWCTTWQVTSAQWSTLIDSCQILSKAAPRTALKHNEANSKIWFPFTSKSGWVLDWKQKHSITNRPDRLPNNPTCPEDSLSISVQSTPTGRCQSANVLIVPNLAGRRNPKRQTSGRKKVWPQVPESNSWVSGFGSSVGAFGQPWQYNKVQHN